MGGARKMNSNEISFYKYGCSNLKNRDRLENIPVDERIILKWIISRQREGEGGSSFIQNMACKKLVWKQYWSCGLRDADGISELGE